MLLLQPVQTLPRAIRDRVESENKEYVCPLYLLKKFKEQFMDGGYHYGLQAYTYDNGLTVQGYPGGIYQDIFRLILKTHRFGYLSCLREMLTRLEDSWAYRLGPTGAEALELRLLWLSGDIVEGYSHSISSESLPDLLWGIPISPNEHYRDSFIEEARLICIDVLERSRASVYVSIDYCFQYLVEYSTKTLLEPMQRTKTFNTAVEVVIPRLFEVQKLQTYWYLDDIYPEQKSTYISAARGAKDTLIPCVYDRGKVEFVIDTVGLFNSELSEGESLYYFRDWLKRVFEAIAYQSLPENEHGGYPSWLPVAVEPTYLDVTIERIV